VKENPSMAAIGSPEWWAAQDALSKAAADALKRIEERDRRNAEQDRKDRKR
jgi:hypothetical protein